MRRERERERESFYVLFRLYITFNNLSVIFIIETESGCGRELNSHF